MFVFRFLSTGLNFSALAYCFRVHHTTINLLVYDTCQAIWDELCEKHMPNPTKEQLSLVAEDYYKMWQFPNCIGAIDGKHIAIRCPPNSGSDYYNYKGFFSNVLQGKTHFN